MAKTSTSNRVLWIIQGLLAVLFLSSGTAKVALPLAELTKQVALPGVFIRFLGVAELLGALGLVLPGVLRIKQALTPVAAACLTVIMAGATVITLAVGGGATAALPLVAGLLTATVARGRWKQLPWTFRIERTRRIASDPEMLFGVISDFHNWPAWSPYEKLDPGMTRTMSGASRGVGAVYEWSGTRKVGAGRMEIIEAVRPYRITMRLDFFKPFQAHHTAEFLIESRGETAEVTWSMRGSVAFSCQLIGMFADMDQIIGREFESGLSNLEEIVQHSNAAMIEG